ncbi:hypothetical protein N658DRAFT_521381 [Parathielavia hyrcaniae]|uniref:Uncharacterized protein n=1 Tax=Parathielavia hyrcaniae TaxID=113614 RepID=A0AAN6T4T4_9PEZI|nr:hypothetical protein N658DRAFT_521381 [Parathielavia hyrcaniae]
MSQCSQPLGDRHCTASSCQNALVSATHRETGGRTNLRVMRGCDNLLLASRLVRALPSTKAWFGPCAALLDQAFPLSLSLPLPSPLSHQSPRIVATGRDRVGERARRLRCLTRNSGHQQVGLSCSPGYSVGPTDCYYKRAVPHLDSDKASRGGEPQRNIVEALAESQGLRLCIVVASWHWHARCAGDIFIFLYIHNPMRGSWVLRIPDLLGDGLTLPPARARFLACHQSSLHRQSNEKWRVWGTTHPPRPMAARSRVSG